MSKLDFRKMPIHDAIVLRQTLQAALACSAEEPILFATEENQDVPTKAQQAVADEILRSVLGSYDVTEQQLPYIVTILTYMEDQLTMLVEDKCLSTFGFNGQPVTSFEWIQLMYGITYDADFQATLRNYTTELAPYACFTNNNWIHDLTEFPLDYNDNLLELKQYIKKCTAELMDLYAGDENPTYETNKYRPIITLAGHTYILYDSAAEYNALLEFIENVIAEQ